MLPFTLVERIALAVFLLSGISFFLYHLLLRLKIVLKGKSNFSVDELPKRIIRVFDEVILHKKVASGKRKSAGILHALVMYGFIFFGLITINHFGSAFGFSIFSDSFRNTYFLIFGAPWAILCTIGILGLAYRRFIIKPEALGKFSATSALVTVFITTLMITYLIDEIHHLNPFMNNTSAKIKWWLHSGVIRVFVFVRTQSEHMHL